MILRMASLSHQLRIMMRSNQAETSKTLIWCLWEAVLACLTSQLFQTELERSLASMDSALG